MKKTSTIAALCLLVSMAQAQTLNSATTTGSTALPSPTPYAVVSRDANSAVWQRTAYGQVPDGSIVPQTQKYIELATGLNHLVNGQWVPSTENIAISADGSSASATNGQHQVYFPGNIYNGEIKLVMPNGTALQSQPIGLSYFDGSNSVLLAVVTNSGGAILSSGNQVIYTNAFAGLDADLLYTYTIAGLEQDVVLRQQPPDPVSLGLNLASTRLQVLTEFINPPPLNVTTGSVFTAVGDLEDDSIGFGAMQMVRGQAFLLGTNSPSASVAKRWLTLNGRQFLIEEVPIVSIAPALDSLPPFTAQTGLGKPIVSKNLVLPPPRLVHATPGTRFLAQAAPPSWGLVLDYVTFNTNGVSNYVFQGDTTYYITNACYFTSGTFTFEGGTVLKYARGAGLNFIGNGGTRPQINWLGRAYRPVIFTAVDDNSAGQAIGSGNPAGSYANPALTLEALTTFSIDGVRIAYAQLGLDVDGNPGKVADAQLVNCQQGILSQSAGTILVENALFSSVQTNFSSLAETTLQVENSTIANSAFLETGQTVYYTNYASVILTNCILANVATLSGSYYDTISGDHNGFYNSPSFGTSQFPTGSNPFQAVGAGSYYLTNGCNFFNAGTTNIDPALLADLQTKTAYAPILLTNVTVSANTTLNPQAQRDTGLPDLGYHYDPIDYLVDQLWVTNAVLTVTNGAAIACYNDSGIDLTDGSSINSIGAPSAPNWFVEYPSVQEQPVSLGPGSYLAINPWHVRSAPNGFFRFTKFACPGAGGYHLYDAQASSIYTNLWVKDCEFWGGTSLYGGGTNTVATLVNNLFVRSVFSTYTNIAPSSGVFLTNNLFWGVSSVNIAPLGATGWGAYNNAFDSCGTISSGTGGLTNNGYNAYLNCTNYLQPTNATDRFVTNTLAYQASWFGTFYQPANSPLIYAGSTCATNVGLYHYTVTTNQAVEGTNLVSIGYHYIATDAYGNPLDSNCDGIPDYLSDANGNGLADNGEINWALAILLQPQGLTVTAGGNATFSVTLTSCGVPPISYQWQFNNTNLVGATNASLTLTNVQATNAGNYSVKISDPAGSLTSSNALLTVLVPPLITQQPTNLMVIQGNNATFSVTLSATSTLPLSYQWQFNTANLVGATNASLTVTNVQTTNAGNYSVVITNVAGSVTSSNALLTVLVPPLLTAQPTNQTVIQGGNATFSVTVSTNSTLPLSYQWWFNATNRLAAATNASMTVTNVQTTNVGNYSVIITNIAGSVTSSNALLTVLVPPIITQQPNNQVATQSSNATFSVTVSTNSTLPLTYQWWFNTNSLLAGATNASLTLTNLQPNQEGTYSVAITNVAGSVTSTNASLTLTCDTCPSGLVAWWQAESNALDSVGTNNGTLSPTGVTYVPGKVGLGFNFDGTNGEITIPDSPVLKPTNLTIEAWVRFSSSNSWETNGAPVGEQYIIEKPNQDGHDGYILFKLRDTNTLRDFFVFGVNTNGTNTWYSPYDIGSDTGVQSNGIQTNVWYHIAGVLGSNVGSNYLQLYVNGQLAASTNFVGTINYGNYPLLFGWSGEFGTTWDAKLKGTLDEIALYNRALSSNEIAAIYNAGTNGKCLLPPAIITQPVSQMASVGETVTLLVAATGSQPMKYQWYDNGNPLAGANSATLTFTNVQTTNSGYYSVIVSNAGGAAVSTNALLNVETCFSYLDVALVASDCSSMSNSLSDGTKKLTAFRMGATNFVQNLVFFDDQAALFSFSTTVTTNLTLTNSLSVLLQGIGTVTNASGSNFMSGALQSAQAELAGPRHRAYALPVMIFLADSDPNDIATNFAATSNLVLAAASQVKLAGTRLITIGLGTNADSTFLRLMASSTNDYYYAATLLQLTNACQSIAASICRASTNTIPVITQQPANQTVIQGSNATFSVTATGTLPLSYQWWFNTTNRLAAATNASLTVTNAQTTNAGNYSVIITNVAGSAISSNALLTVLVPPIITQQPLNVTTNVGGNATFSVTVSTNSTLPLSYQWKFNTTNLLAGATNASLTVTNVQTTNAGNYSVVITNVVGSLTSSNALLTVWVPPIITRQPLNVTTNVGGSATFSVVVSTNSTLPLTYQWWFNTNTQLSGATNASLTLTNVQTTNAGNYSVAITNVAGSTTSSNALLTVLVPPIITQQPLNVTTNVGGNATFSVTVSTNSTPPLSYQWKFNTTNLLAGATNASLTVTNVQTTNMGTYLVVITNVAGSVISSNALLTVLVPPIITQQPLNVTTNVGGNATFSVTVSTNSTLPLSYQWWFNTNSLLAGATNASLTVTNVQTTNAGNYSVAITNVAGSVTSSNALLTVLVPLTITITNPTNNQLFATSPLNISLAATASDAGGTVTNVQFFSGTNSLGNGGLTTSNTWTMLWVDVLAGNYTLTAEAFDSAGHTATNAVSFTVNAMPVIYITSPTNDQSYTEMANVTLQAVAYDPNSGGSISGVGFYGAQTNLPYGVTITNTTNFTSVWSNLLSGWYPVVAVATNNNGAATWSGLTIFTVASTNLPPTVIITSPTNGQVFADASDITITAVVTNGTGITTNVEFFSNGNDLGGDASTNNPYSITICCWQPGTYQLMAFATDNLGSSAISSNVQITVSQPAPASEGFWDPSYYIPMYYNEGGPDDYYGPGPVAYGQDGLLYSSYIAYGNIFAFDGTNVLYVGGCLSDCPDALNGIFNAMIADGTNIYAGGVINIGVDPTNHNVIQCSGTNWEYVGDGLGNGLAGGEVWALAKAGGDLYAGGSFTYAGIGDNENVQRIAKLDPISGTWQPVGNGITNGTVYAIAGVGNNLYIGGSFTNAGGNPQANYIAELVGTNWVALGTGVSGTNGAQGFVTALAACGSTLYVGGFFSIAGSHPDANGVAIWDGGTWQTMNGGVVTNVCPDGDPTDLHSTPGFDGYEGFGSSEDYYNMTNSMPLVYSLAVHGQQVFVGGQFNHILSGTNQINAYGIAMVTWSDAEQSWIWSDLDEGVDPYSTGLSYNEIDGLYGPYLKYVQSMAIHSAPSGSAFDLYVGGSFFFVGSSLLPIEYIARWRVGYPAPPSAPVVTITSPTSPAIYTHPATITLTGLATSSYTNIWFAGFYTNGVLVTNLDVAPPNTKEYAFSNQWAPPAGVYLVTAIAQDVNTNFGVSQPLVLDIKSGSSYITAVDDTYVIPPNTPAVNLYVLTNDSSNGPFKISSVLQPHANLGFVSVSFDGSYLIYRPFPNAFGTDVFYYTITNSYGSDSASVTVKIHPLPSVEITQPEYSVTQIPATNGVITISGYSSEYGGTITNVNLYVNGALLGQTTNCAFTNNWSTTTNGIYSFVAVAADQDGFTNASAPDDVIVYSVTNVIIAAINNLGISISATTLLSSYPFISTGLFDLQGEARAYSGGTNIPVAYQVSLYNPGAYDAPIANLTPQPDASGLHQGGDNTNDLGVLDFSGVVNGVYDIVLTVYGAGAEVAVTNRFILDSQLKIGQFSFSEQDLVLPVNGVPITITRTYNSQNPLSSDFGYGWSFSINDMDVQLDEERQDVMVDTAVAPWSDAGTSPGSLPPIISIRSGGGWDVSLTLPNGQRTTFAFSLNGYTAQWTAPLWVHYSLVPSVPGSDQIYLYPEPIWVSSSQDGSCYDVPIQNQDFPGWILTNQVDGTQYYLYRGSATNIAYDPNNDGSYVYARVYGQPQLTQIVQRSGDKIVITNNGVFHYAPNTSNPSRPVYFTRDTQGRITDIYDPVGGTNGLPVLQYVYDQDYGNLIQVLKLVNRSTGVYATNKYDYNNPAFPHYITSIENGDGIPVAQNFYDNNGRLTSVVDANGNTTYFNNNTTGTNEVVVDRLGHTNTFVYDNNGNVIAQTNALGQLTTMAYDANNNKTNQIVYLGNQPYATNNYIYSPLNLLLSSTDPLGHTSTFAYDWFGELTNSTDANTNTTVNTYDGYGDLISTRDALGDPPTVNAYTNGLLVGSQDALGNVTTNYYDGNGNLIATATLATNTGAILSSNSFGYDLNGNRTNSTVWRFVGGSWTPAITTYFYDAMNRVIQTINPDGGTSTVVYDLAGRQIATTDPLNHTYSYLYDNLGRLIQTIYPDNTTETNGYDANGNRIVSADRNTNITTYAYDALNRLTNTVYADNATSTTIYDGVGRVAQTIDARGTITAFAYDAAGRRLAVTNAVGTTVANTNFYTYDPNGNQLTFTDANGHTTTNVFDALNRQIQVQCPDGTKTSTGYDADGRRVAQTNQDTIVTLFGYDGAGRLISVTNNATGTGGQQMVTQFAYDQAGNETAQIDALGRTNTFAYDGMGRRISHTMPGGQTESFYYDVDGNLTNQVTFNGVAITNRYDLLNRLTSCSSVNGYQVSYAYSPTGQRTNMTDLSGVTGYAYDVRDRLTNKAVSWIGGTNITLNYRYDAAGNSTNLWSSTANGVNLAYAYDALNRLTNVLANGTAAAGYAYDFAGNLQSLQYGNGVTNLNLYDSLNRLTNSVWKLNTSTLASFYYQLGLSGNRTNLNENVNSASRTYQWQYDPLYRLTNEVVSGASPTGALGYQYDAVGNRLNRTAALGLPAQSLNYNTNDWLKTDTYDNNGNTLWTTNSGTGYGPYNYDVLNRLTNSGNVYLTYDGDGIRAKKVVGSTTNFYLVDDRNPSGYAQVLEEWTSTSTPTLSKVYNYGLSLVSQQQGSTTYYFVTDGHGSTRLLIDGNGTIQNVFAYDAYGTLVSSNGSPQTAYLYCGQQFDSDLGLYYNRARYLNQNTGRFWTMDTYAGDNEDPLSLHKYLYAQDDPVDNDDPSGNAIYFVERELSKGFGPAVWPLGIGHGYLYFTDPSDPGTGDPFTTHQTPIDSFSWHPNVWDYRGSRAPGRIWEDDTEHDWNPPSQHLAVCATTDPGAEVSLLNCINTWKDETGCGYELGYPKQDNITPDPHNDIGSVDHKPAPPGGVYYSVYGQNCVWWATIMLKQSNIQVNPAVYKAIFNYELGGGSANHVIMGWRSAYDVRTLNGMPVGINISGLSGYDLSDFDTGL